MDRGSGSNNSGNIRYAILTALAVTGVAVLAVAMPNILQAIDGLDRSSNRKRKSSRETSVSRSLRSLVKQGLVEYIDKDRLGLRLTIEGRKLFHRLELGELRYKKPDKWDGKWRMVIFDILEKQRFKRDGLRSLLRQIGFYRLQQSVWIFPYECESLVKLLKIDQELGKDTQYILAEKIENDTFVKKHFDLD